MQDTPRRLTTALRPVSRMGQGLETGSLSFFFDFDRASCRPSCFSIMLSITIMHQTSNTVILRFESPHWDFVRCILTWSNEFISSHIVLASPRSQRSYSSGYEDSMPNVPRNVSLDRFPWSAHHACEATRPRPRVRRRKISKCYYVMR